MGVNGCGISNIDTPQENSYIEAYHSILQTEVVKRFEMNSYYEAKLIMTNYVHFYNNKRLHGSLKIQTPQSVWGSWYEQNKPPTKGERLSSNTEESPLLEKSEIINLINQKFQTFTEI